MASGLSYDKLVKASRIDRYERNDYRLNYVCTACDDENLSDEAAAQMHEYMEALETAESNSIPYYLGECYFKLGNQEKAFAMLRKYTAYTASNADSWNKAFALAKTFADKSAAFTEGLSDLYRQMLDWNAQSTLPIQLDDGIQAFVSGAVEK